MDIGFASDIVTMIIRSAANSIIGSELGEELIGTSIDGVSKKIITEINNFFSGKKSKMEHILSKENMKELYVTEENIDFVVAELKDLLSKIEITDRVFRKCRYNHKYLKDFLWSEYCKDKYIVESKSDIRKGLYAVAKTLIELMRESEEFEKELLIHMSNTINDIQLEIEDDSSNVMKRFDRLEEGNQAILDKVSENSSILNKDETHKKIESRTQEYIRKWNQNMFLNDFNKRDENAGVNVKLSEVYLEKHLPHYIWKNNKNSENDLKDLLSEYIIEKGENKMLLILGQPGIGKSTLITWIVANFKNNTDNILVYQFASDLKNVDWKNTSEKYDLVYAIINALNLPYLSLDGKILILDGFDEISLEYRIEIINRIYWKLIKEFPPINFSMIITCRENYIYNLNSICCDYIILQPWNEEQIYSFCTIYHQKINSTLSAETLFNILKNKKILGIPLILYMVLALHIVIEKKGSIVNVYDRVFAIDGGIYDRSIVNIRYASPHRIYEIKKQIHQISRNIAIWMFENEPYIACIPQNEYENICSDVMKKQIQLNKEVTQDVLIGNYFSIVCDGIGTEEICFVHRSIYEYFVAEQIFDWIINAINIPKENLARNLACLFECTFLSKEIIEFLKYKVNHSRLEDIIIVIISTFELMLENGMTSYTNHRYRKVIEYEMCIFSNMLELVHLWENNILRFENSISSYLIYNRRNKLNLRNLYLKDADLKRVDLFEADLRNADLRGVNLEYATVVNADLRGANLLGTILYNANLDEAIFDEKQIVYLQKGYNLHGTRVYIENTDEIISYEEYCRRKK